MKEQRESYSALSQEEKEDVENSIMGDSEDTVGPGKSQNQIFNYLNRYFLDFSTAIQSIKRMFCTGAENRVMLAVTLVFISIPIQKEYKLFTNTCLL